MLEKLESMMLTLCLNIPSAFDCFNSGVIKHFKKMTNRRVSLLKQNQSQN